MSFLLASAARATVGARSGQEDAFRLWPGEGLLQPKTAGEGLLAVLADGMGGHAGGAVAGQTACEKFAETFAATGGPYDGRLDNALRASNDALARGVEKNAALRGMGCTLVAAWIDDAGVRWTSVGDSLLLLYRFPDVIRLNADHSLGSYLDEQARQNRITESEARAAPNRNALRSALTGAKIDIIDLHGDPLELKAGDWLLLASDGIASLAGDELANVIYQFREAAPDQMADGLIAAVERKGVPEQDNTTVVAVRIDGSQDGTGDLVTTRIMRPDARHVAPREEVAEATAKARAQQGSSLLAISPAVWLGAAAGLLLVAIVLAMRLLPMSAPPPAAPPPIAPAATAPPRMPTPAPKDATQGGTPPPLRSPIRIPPGAEQPPNKPTIEADRSGPKPIQPREAAPPPQPLFPPAPAPVPARPPMEAPDQMPRVKKEAEPTSG